jgi:predicted O-methyltransferase YrrM
MSDVIELARGHIEHALANRDSVDLSWLGPLPAEYGWTLAADALRMIDALVRELRPKHVIEFGAGLSTKVLARACQQMGAACAISSIDHDPEFGVSDTRKYVESTKNLTLSSQIAPLVARDYGGKLLPTYLWDKARLASTAPADLVLIDGPPVDLGGREGVLYQVMESCRPGTIVLLDDAARKAEKAALAHWTDVLGEAVDVQRLPNFTKGMAAIVIKELVKAESLWQRRVARATRLIESLVPSDGTFVLVDGGNFGQFADDRRPVPLVRRGDEDWGPPENSEAALAELGARRNEGATHFVLPWTSFWWFETYPEFCTRLASSKPLASELIWAVDLRKQ